MLSIESAEKLCEEFNTLAKKVLSVNKLKKDEKVSEKDKYPWLEDSDVHQTRKHMTDKEILDKYIDLDNSCLTD